MMRRLANVSRFSLPVLAILLFGCGEGEQHISSTAPAASAPDATSPAEKATVPTTTGINNAQPVFRFAKISNGAYFYTGSVAERDLIIRNYPDFRCEGVAFFRTADDSGIPVYRFANLANGGYFYTASDTERDFVIRTRPDMRYEGSTFSVSGALTRAQVVYRLANTRNGAYFYTASYQEGQYAIGQGDWRYEGEAFYGTPSPSNLNTPAGGWCPPSPAPAPAPGPGPTSNAEGLWTGWTSNGYSLSMAVLENGEIWGIYFAGGRIYGAIYGQSTGAGGTFSAAGSDYSLVNWSITSGTYRGTVTPKGEIQATSSKGPTISLLYDGSYDQPATLAALAGQYTVSGVSARGSSTNIPMSISTSGSVTVPTVNGCGATGRVSPRANGKNIYSLSLTFAGSNCAIRSGTPTNGIVILDRSTTPNLALAMALTSTKDDGFIAVGAKN